MALLFLEMKQYIFALNKRMDIRGHCCVRSFFLFLFFFFFTGARNTSVFLWERGEAQSALVPHNRGPRKQRRVSIERERSVHHLSETSHAFSMSSDRSDVCVVSDAFCTAAWALLCKTEWVLESQQSSKRW